MSTGRPSATFGLTIEAGVKREAGVWALGALWFAATLAAGFAWERYDFTPGPTAAPQAACPAAGAGGWRLTAFVHPHCPCSRATVRQLLELAGECPQLRARAVFVRPPGTPAGWERGELWAEVERADGLTAACDVGGVEARKAGAETSGEVILTDPSGRTVFRGGLTTGRGRDGDSEGRRVVLGWVRGEPSPASAPVYGCPLHTPGE